MIPEEPYPLFIPEVPLPSFDRTKWSKHDAERQFEWFMSIKDERVAHLLAYFGQSIDSIPAALRGIGEAVIAGIESGRFTQEDDAGGITLTNEALAIGVNIGLLMATGMEMQSPDLFWDIVRKPKDHISYNLPVLRGFRIENKSFEPMQIGTSCVWGFLDGKGSTNASEAYEVWQEYLKF